jgi:hypothetical protein
MKLRIVKFRRNAEFASALKNCTAGSFEILQNTVKDTGNWLVIKLADGQVLLIDAGSLAADHVDGRADIFTDTPEEGKDCELRADLKIGIRGGKIIYA